MHTFHAPYRQFLCSISLKIGGLTLRDGQEHVHLLSCVGNTIQDS